MTVLGEFLPDGPAFPKGRSWPFSASRCSHTERLACFCFGSKADLRNLLSESLRDQEATLE